MDGKNGHCGRSCAVLLKFTEKIHDLFYYFYVYNKNILRNVMYCSHSNYHNVFFFHLWSTFYLFRLYSEVVHNNGFFFYMYIYIYDVRIYHVQVYLYCILLNSIL